MATDTHAGPLGELQAASSAGGGTALTTTAAFVELPDGVHHLFLIPRNFATAVVVKVALNPYLIILKTADALATVTSYSKVAQQKGAATTVVLDALDTAANNNYLFIGSHYEFRGVNVTVTSANSNAATLAVKYWKGSWADISPTDGTANAGATFGQTGNITWTVPSDWVKATLNAIGSPAPTAGAIEHQNDSLYWVRMDVSAALSATVHLSKVLAMNRATSYAELPNGVTMEQRIRKGPFGIGCIEALTDAGTANLIVNVAAQQGEQGGLVP